MEYRTFRLANGIRVLWVPSSSSIAHACILINAGAGDEHEHEYGIAHFVEHLLFKRTEKRSTNQILNRLESVGADLNAYTTKEYTCVHASFLQPYLKRTLELFEDIIFHSTFPDKEIVKEREIIVDEIASYKDTPEDALGDDFEDQVFEGHPFGHNILGTVESLQGIGKEDISQFVARQYRTEAIVLAVSGNYPAAKVENLSKSIFGDLANVNNPPTAKGSKVDYKVRHNYVKQHITQAHCMLGNVAYDLYHHHKAGMMLLNNILGGMGMSSRLNLQLREKYGIAYTIESNFSPYLGTGIFSIYFGTDVEKIAQAIKLINKELSKLREQAFGKLQLQQAKRKFIGQIALAEEGRMGVLISMAKNLLDYDKVNTLEDVFFQIEKVSATDILEIANETLDSSKMSMLCFVPDGTDL